MVAITATAASRTIETTSIATFGCGTFRENWPRLGPAARNRPVRMPSKVYPIQPSLALFVHFVFVPALHAYPISEVKASFDMQRRYKAVPLTRLKSLQRRKPIFPQ